MQDHHDPAPPGDNSSVPRQSRLREGNLPCTTAQISVRLREATEPMSFRQIADATGFHHESVRRYLNRPGTIPATFIASIAVNLGIDPILLLCTSEDGSSGELPMCAKSYELADEALEAMRPMLQAWFASRRSSGDGQSIGHTEAGRDIEPKPAIQSRSARMK